MKKKVLLVSCKGLGNGGVQAVMMSIVRNLNHKYVFDILLFTNKKGFYEEEFESYGGEIIRIPYYEGVNRILKKFDILFRQNYVHRELLKVLDDHGPYYAMHCNNGLESAFCLKAANKKGIPVRIAHIHSNITDNSIIAKTLNNVYASQIEHYATDMIACSERAYRLAFNNNDVRVVPNSYNNKVFDPQKYRLKKNDEFTLAQVGYFCPNKNQLFSLRVFKRIIKTIPNARIDFVGFDVDGYKKHLEQECTISGIENHVRFHESDANIAELLSASHVFLLPSVQEGFGIVAIEAQAMGNHCFVSDSVPEITNAGGCTYLSLDSGEDKWAERIVEWYINNKDVPQKYNCEAFTEEAIIAQFERLYDEL